MRRPATQGRCEAIPTMDACVRWLAPKASFTKRSARDERSRAKPGSFSSSPRVNAQVFEHNDITVLHGGHCLLHPRADSPLSASTGIPRRSDRHRATGSDRRRMSTLPWGLPRWEQRMTRAPCPVRYIIVGRHARIRLSSSIFPSGSRGTLKSTRTSTRFPRTSASFTVFFCMLTPLLQFFLKTPPMYPPFTRFRDIKPAETFLFVKHNKDLWPTTRGDFCGDAPGIV